MDRETVERLQRVIGLLQLSTNCLKYNIDQDELTDEQLDTLTEALRGAYNTTLQIRLERLAAKYA
jgi:hypothetical protein